MNNKSFERRTPDNNPGIEESCEKLMSLEEINKRKSQLSDMELRITQDRCTERPFSNRYNNHFEEGCYHCVVCQAKLFASGTKFKSGSGWPAFSNVLNTNDVKLKQDVSHVGANLLLLIAKPDLARTEVSCANCNAHLGHLFKDGPKPTGLRYCINSSALLFVPATSCQNNTCTSLNSTENFERASGCCNETSLKPAISTQSSAKMCFFQAN